MRVVIINPPHTAIGSRIPDDHLPPLGLLSIGGPLIDAKNDVVLIDADRTNMAIPVLCKLACEAAPEVVLIGHSGSTSVHPTAVEIAEKIKHGNKDVIIIYGGVFPTYHWQDILKENRCFDFIVRGEGEVTIVELMDALSNNLPLSNIDGIAWRGHDGIPIATQARAMSASLDHHRVGWELIDHKDYSYWGGKRAVVLQFSRGCPHPCNYCGQRGFWTRWRHRDPVKFAAEIARLYREQGVVLINLADENPTSSRKAWKAFLEAMIAEDVPVQIVGSTRADDIVRDADILHLYRKAGVVRWLMGMENTDEATLRLIRKGGATSTDRQAIQLLREHDILSMATWVVGFEDETIGDLWRGLGQLLSYDPDQIQALFVTPHRWTPFFRLAENRVVIQTDIRKWDYKHQVLRMKNFHPVLLGFIVKLIEVSLQARPKAVQRVLFHRDRAQRHSMRWYTQMGRRVWFREIFDLLFRDKHDRGDVTLKEFWGDPLDQHEEAMRQSLRKHKLNNQPELVSKESSSSLSIS